MGGLERYRDWRVDRIARRPSGRRARRIYGADDAHAFLWEPVLAALALGPDDRLLDAGCGGGAFLRHVEATIGCAVAGVDHSRAMARLAARKTPAARVVRADVAATPFADGEFTAVSSLAAFFHFPDPRAALCELRRVLDPERGRLAILTTSEEARGTPAAPERVAGRSRFYPDEELVALAREAGFGDAAVARPDPWTQLLRAVPAQP